MKLSRRCLIALSLIPSLDTLVTRFHSDMEYYLGIALEGDPVAPATAVRRTHAFGDVASCFSQFQNLRKLALLNIWGDLIQWRTAIVDVLQQSPRLQSLALAIGEGTVESCQRRGDAIPVRQVQERSYYRFLYGICEQSRERGLQPLSLHSLRLGNGIGFPDFSCLSHLLDLTKMKDIHIYNE